jgi:hypothetical protein
MYAVIDKFGTFIKGFTTLQAAYSFIRKSGKFNYFVTVISENTMKVVK